MKKMLWAAAAATAFISTAALATVTFDNTTGTGFVGKGDVQIALGWNNATLQRNANGVTFTYNTTDTYDVTCEWDTGTRNIVHHVITLPKHTGVNATIGSTGRNTSSGLQGPNTGFILTGFGQTIVDGTLPEVGGSCLGFGADGTITDVELTSSTGGLFTNYGGNSVQLNWPVVI